MLQKKVQWWAHSNLQGLGGPFLTIEDAWDWMILEDNRPQVTDRVWCTVDKVQVELVPEIKTGKVPPYKVIPRNRKYTVGAS